jgi:hypothetical protein
MLSLFYSVIINEIIINIHSLIRFNKLKMGREVLVRDGDDMVMIRGVKLWGGSG